MQIGIIGGDGFLGRALQEQLRASNTNFQAYDLEPRTEDCHYVNVEHLETLSCIQGSDVIINLAAEHRDDVEPLSRYTAVNIEGAENICAAATDAGVKKIIFTSSVAVYGFAPEGTSETGIVNPFNEYGRTKHKAEEVFKKWLYEKPTERSLVIVRPTVIFGEGNRGNVFNLVNQIAKKRFVMIGNGLNVKSMAYVRNVAAFLEFSTRFGPGLHVYNYVDEPSMNMNELVSLVRGMLFGKRNVGVRLPAFFGALIGRVFDVFAQLIGKKFPISHIRVEKFMASSVYSTAVRDTGFVPPFALSEAFTKTVEYEFKTPK